MAKPSKREKSVLRRMLNPENWLIFKKTDGQLHLLHRNTFATRVIPNL